MAYDEGLAQRVRDAAGPDTELEEKEMFGGLCFLVNGNMACGVVGEDLMVRVGKENYEAAMDRPGAREMDFTGKALKGFVYVGSDTHEDDDALADWVDQGVSYAASLPAK